MPELRAYQMEAVKDLVDKKRILIADDMGLGKCAESIIGAKAVHRQEGYTGRTLIVCPASVADHWEDEIGIWYDDGGKNKIKKIQCTSYDQDIKDAEDYNFIIVGYPTLSRYGRNEHKIDNLRKLDFQYGILDEAHNAKNPASTRSRGVKELFDSVDYLSILSGTPIPNTIPDIYMLLSLLDNESFPLDPDNTRAALSGFYTLFRSDPEFVRRALIGDRMIRRKAEEYLPDKFPKLNQSHLETELTGDHADVYMAIHNNDDIKPSTKLIQLIKASIDPNLVNPDFLKSRLASKSGRMDSCTYDALDDKIDKITSNGGKVLMFSNLRKGVTNRLKRRYADYGAVVIDKEVTSNSNNGGLSKREETRRRFQEDPECKVLIATTVMDEGVDLTAATDIFHLTLPYDSAAFKQRNRRSQRIGEIDKESVNAYTVMPHLDMIPVVTEGMERLLQDKERIIEYLLDKPLLLTKEDLDEIKNGKIRKSKHIAPLVRSPIRGMDLHMGLLRGKGFNKIMAHYSKYPQEAEYVAKLYAAYWEGYYAGNTASLYGQAVNILQESHGLERKLDVASGPFSLSRVINEPVTNLDLSNYMLKAGQILEDEGKVVPGNESVQGAMHQLPFADNSFDLAVCSLALHMTRLDSAQKDGGINEREAILREMNRVLDTGGYSLITLPYTVISSNNLKKFHKGLESLGFDVLPFSGFYKARDSKFRVYLAGLKKISQPGVEPLKKNSLAWKMDTMVGEKKRRSKKKRKHSLPSKKNVIQEFLSDFYHTGSRRSLEESIRGCV